MRNSSRFNFTIDVEQLLEVVNFKVDAAAIGLQGHVNDLLAKLEPIVFDAQGHFKTSLTKSEARQYDKKIISSFCRSINEWYAIEGQIECARYVLHISDTHWGCQQHQGSFFEKSDVKDLLAMDRYVENHQFECAYDIAQKYATRFAKPQSNFFLKHYHRRFGQTHNYQGIKHKHLNSLYYEKHFAHLPASHLPSSCNVVLDERQALKDKVWNDPYRKPSKEVDQILENIVDLYPQGIGAVTEFFCKQVYADHPNAQLSKEFKKLSNSWGGPRWVSYNAAINGVQFSPAIKNADHAQDRIVIAQLGQLSLDVCDRAKIAQAAAYINHSFASNALAHSYGMLGNVLAQELISGQPGIVSRLPDLW